MKKRSSVLIGLLVIFIFLFIPLYADQIREIFYQTWGSWPVVETIVNSPWIKPIWDILDFAALLFVIGGTIGSTIVGFSVQQLGKATRYLVKYLFKNKSENDLHGIYTNFEHEIEKIYDYALTLGDKRYDREPIGNDIEIIFHDPQMSKWSRELFSKWLADFLNESLNESDEENIEEIIQAEIQVIENKANEDIEIFQFMTQAAPAFGMAGTITGLVLLLRSELVDLGNIESLIQPMSIALLTTLYGVLLSNIIFNPAIAKRTELRESVSYSLSMIRDVIIYLKRRIHPNDISSLLINYIPEEDKQEFEKKQFYDAMDRIIEKEIH